MDIALEGDELPSAFRLFKAGANETTKGVFIFDAAAATAVLAAANAHSVDLMVDLEHLSLDQESRAYDPDARAWLNLEVRNGELWAVNVRWTDDGARRLRAKTQRYISPAFAVDDDNRVIEIVNIALTAMPATHGTPALVAANRSPRMSVKETARALIPALAAKLSTARAKVKLAEDGGEAPAGKAASVKAACEKAAASLEDLTKAFGGSDIDATFAAMEAAKAAMAECEAKIDAMTGGAAPAPAPEAEAMSEATPAEETEKMARERAELIALRKEKAQREEDEKITKLAAEMTERADLEAKLVKLGRETPATVKMLSGLPLADLRKRVEMFDGLDGFKLGAAPQPPIDGGNRITAGDALVELSEFEAQRVTAYAERKAIELKSAGLTPRPTSEVLARYAGHREQQFRGAKTSEQRKLLGRRIEQRHVLLSRDERLVTLASVKPIEEMGPSSQRANEEFVMKYNMCLAAEPKVWAELLGDMLPSGSVTKDTFPINLSALRYRKRTAQEAAAEKALNFDISVTKDEFYAAAQAELRRLNAGDFAYVQWWGRRAEQMARARVYLRNQLVTTILEAGESGYWGSSTELATGIDGVAFFSASHKVHPRDASKTLRGSATWSNLQASAKVLNAVNLTGEKVAAFQVADPAGYEFGFEYDTMVVPSSLNEVAKNLITVQDLIIEAGTVNGVANAFAATKNPHFQSGMEVLRAPDLAGTDTTADWYLISRAALSQGLFPWLISEDAAEDLRTWDESSDFTKDTGEIKVSSHIYANAALLFPHGIRKVSGT